MVSVGPASTCSKLPDSSGPLLTTAVLVVGLIGKCLDFININSENLNLDVEVPVDN